MDKTITVLTVDDHPLLREGIAAVIAGASGLEVAGEATNGSHAIDQFRRLRPDITLMDLQMPGLGGIETIKLIRNEFPDARIIVLTTYKGDAQVIASLKAGATGYLLKSMLRKELLDAIRAVHQGRRWIPSEVAMNLAEYAVNELLSDREVQVLSAIADGGTNKSVARRLGVTDETVRSHIKNILAKLGASDRTHAVVIAMKRGIIQVEG